MARDADIIRTADICDEFGDELLVCELALNDYAARHHFHGEVMTFATYEDNQGVRELLARGGAGKVLVVDGRGSRRRALCGGNIAAEALKRSPIWISASRPWAPRQCRRARTASVRSVSRSISAESPSTLVTIFTPTRMP
jgi:hypothetical protein